MRRPSSSAALLAAAAALAPAAALACECVAGPMKDADLAAVDLIAEVDIGARSWGSALCGKTRSYIERPAAVRRVLHGRAAARTLRLRMGASGPFFGRCEVVSTACDFEPEGRMVLLLERISGNVYAPRSSCAHVAYDLRPGI